MFCLQSKSFMYNQTKKVVINKSLQGVILTTVMIIGLHKIFTTKSGVYTVAEKVRARTWFITSIFWQAVLPNALNTLRRKPSHLTQSGSGFYSGARPLKAKL